jgi:Rod binding domain-containing protein
MAVNQVFNSALTQTASTLTQAASPSIAKDNFDKIRRAATDFESLLLSQMLRSARESISGDDEDSEANSSLIDLGEQQFAQVLAANGGLGIGKMVVARLNHAD